MSEKKTTGAGSGLILVPAILMIIFGGIFLLVQITQIVQQTFQFIFSAAAPSKYLFFELLLQAGHLLWKIFFLAGGIFGVLNHKTLARARGCLAWASTIIAVMLLTAAGEMLLLQTKPVFLPALLLPVLYLIGACLNLGRHASQLRKDSKKEI